MNNKKKLAVAGVSTLGVAVVGLGAYAYFSDNATDQTSGTVGTVDIGVDTPVINHYYEGVKAPNNLNPGDNQNETPERPDPTPEDPDNPNYTDPDDPNSPDYDPENIGDRHGTDHELSFTITNSGTKSVMTRTKITVTAKDKNGQDITADHLINIILSEQTAKKEVEGAGYLPDADEYGRLTAKDYFIVKETPEAYEATDTSLLYVIGGNRAFDVLDGVGEGAELETVNDIADNNNANDQILWVKKTFDIGLDKAVGTDAASPLEGATITFTVEVQAMQYRNTSASDWETLSINKVDMPAG